MELALRWVLFVLAAVVGVRGGRARVAPGAMLPMQASRSLSRSSRALGAAPSSQGLAPSSQTLFVTGSSARQPLSAGIASGSINSRSTGNVEADLLETPGAAPIFQDVGERPFAAVARPAEARASFAASPSLMIAGAAFTVVALAGARSSRRRSSVSRSATETFKQGTFTYPSAYELIANTTPTEKKCDIICTIGPKSWDPEVLVKLMDAGMNIIRCNMSHGDHEEQSMKLANLEKAYEMRPEFRGKVKVLMDTRGPEIRTGTFEVYNSKKELKAGQDLKLVTDYSVKGDESQVAITYQQLPRDVKEGQRILVQDGTVVLEVTGTGDDYVMTKVLNDAKLGEKKNVNVPGVKVDIPVVGEREITDIEGWAVPNNADYIALSFVQSPDDVKECRKHCADKPIKIISKIENVEGLKNFEQILAESDGIMVARGDLGMEIPMEKVWMAQKMMISKTKAAGKYVVTATEMLASMEDKPFPTRAEACDVANAVLDGTSAVMLSSESAMGDFPVETVTTMRRIVEEAETALSA